MLGDLPAYLLIAAVICYVTWPHLWTDPLGRLLKSFHVVSSYPWQVVLIVLVLLAGVIDGVRLYPYEYMYYNR